MSEIQCENCLYWKITPEAGEGVGLCRRHPPQVTWINAQNEQGEIGVQKRSSFPNTNSVDACGEFFQSTKSRREVLKG